MRVWTTDSLTICLPLISIRSTHSSMRGMSASWKATAPTWLRWFMPHSLRRSKSSGVSGVRQKTVVKGGGRNAEAVMGDSCYSWAIVSPPGGTERSRLSFTDSDRFTATLSEILLRWARTLCEELNCLFLTLTIASFHLDIHWRALHRKRNSVWAARGEIFLSNY